MSFINVPMIWQKLEVVRMVNCNLPECEEEVDYGGIGELLLRSRVKVLEMTHTHLGDHGWDLTPTRVLYCGHLW